MMKRSDFIKQSNTSQSGLTCLLMICRYYGRHIELATMMRTENSLQEISNNADTLGLSCIVGYLPLAKLSKITLPCLMYWDDKYYVVLHKIKFRTYYVADPTKGFIKYSQTEIKGHCVKSNITNEEKVAAVFIKPTDEFYKQAKEQNQLIKGNSIWRYIKHFFSWGNRIL